MCFRVIDHEGNEQCPITGDLPAAKATCDALNRQYSTVETDAGGSVIKDANGQPKKKQTRAFFVEKLNLIHGPQSAKPIPVPLPVPPAPPAPPAGETGADGAVIFP